MSYLKQASFISTITLLLISNVGHSDEYSKEIENVLMNAEIIKSEPDTKFTSILGLELGKSTITDVKNSLGEVNIQFSGDAGTAAKTVCYRGSDGTTLIFESSEMGGGAGITTSSTLIAKGTKETNRDTCLLQKKISRKVGTTAGARLGLSQADIKKRFGKPSATKSQSLVYAYEYDKKINDKVFNGLVVLHFSLTNNSVTKLSISKVESD